MTFMCDLFCNGPIKSQWNPYFFYCKKCNFPSKNIKSPVEHTQTSVNRALCLVTKLCSKFSCQSQWLIKALQITYRPFPVVIYVFICSIIKGLHYFFENRTLLPCGTFMKPFGAKETGGVTLTEGNNIVKITTSYWLIKTRVFQFAPVLINIPSGMEILAEDRFQ